MGLSVIIEACLNLNLTTCVACPHGALDDGLCITEFDFNCRASTPVACPHGQASFPRDSG